MKCDFCHRHTQSSYRCEVKKLNGHVCWRCQIRTAPLCPYCHPKWSEENLSYVRRAWLWVRMHLKTEQAEGG